MAVDEIARRHGFSPWRRRFQGETADGTLDGERVTLLKPLTFMNEFRARGAGSRELLQARRSAISPCFRTRLELPAAKVRVKVGGGIAGHNGLRSISAHIGNDYRRVRLGSVIPASRNWCTATCCPISPRANGPGSRRCCDAIADNAGLLVDDSDSTFQNKVHLALQAKGFLDKDDGESKTAPSNALTCHTRHRRT